MKIWLAKVLAKKLIKTIEYKINLNKIDKYVHKPNELDRQMKQIQKNQSKILHNQENIEKDLAILGRDSHPPIFTKSKMNKIEKRLRKLEKNV
jgi:hypothetical protein